MFRCVCLQVCDLFCVTMIGSKGFFLCSIKRLASVGGNKKLKSNKYLSARIEMRAEMKQFEV